MRIFVHMVFLNALLFYCSCKHVGSNELALSTKNLDSNLRKALLKALTELENDADSNKSNSESHSLVEKASASAISVYQNDNAKTEKSLQKIEEVEQEKKKQIVVVQKSNGLQHKPITTFIPSNASDHFITSASSSFNNVPKNAIKKQNYIQTTEKNENLSSPFPTIETPTTEENEAKVEDVQFISAPLVAAFTVHQDERGLPKSVEPIYKASTPIPTFTNFVDDNKYKIQDEIIKKEKLKTQHLKDRLALQEKQRILEEQVYKLQRQQKEQQEFLYRQQQFIQEQHRKLLEEREKNRIQQSVHRFAPITSTNIGHSQINTLNDFHEQNPSQQSTNFQFNPSQVDLTNGHNTPLNDFNAPSSQGIHHFNNHAFNHATFGSPIIPNHINKANGISSPENQFVTSNPLKSEVVFQTSVTLTPADHLNKINELPLNAQQLPVKNSNDFRQSHYVQNSFNQIQSHLVPPHQATYHNVNFAQSTDNLQPQNVRIFRQEPATGNFFNNDFNRSNFNPSTYSIQQSVPVNNIRPLRSSLEAHQSSAHLPVQQPIAHQHLNNLLINSGIGHGPQEDLGIVSKILSYNHLGGNNFFSGSRYFTPIHRSDKKV